MDLDLHVGRDLQPPVRVLELDAGDRISERIELLSASISCRRDRNGVLQTLLIRRRSRHQMQ
jgi:hypothetical protein